MTGLSPGTRVVKKISDELIEVANKTIGIRQPGSEVLVSQPSGKLISTNIGIKSTLDPPKEYDKNKDDELLPNQAEHYTVEQLQYAWKEYYLKVKREKRDSLYATLLNSEMRVGSNHMVTIKIKNSLQSAELDIEKGELIKFLRSKLKNTKINLQYKMEERPAIAAQDSKSKFDRLAEENSSLHKFRKLFNLDIEY